MNTKPWQPAWWIGHDGTQLREFEARFSDGEWDIRAPKEQDPRKWRRVNDWWFRLHYGASRQEAIDKFVARRHGERKGFLDSVTRIDAEIARAEALRCESDL